MQHTITHDENVFSGAFGNVTFVVQQQGFLVTTGSYTGLDFKEPGDAVSIEFVGFGGASVTFEA